MLVKLLSFALIHFHFHHERGDGAASNSIILFETSRSRHRIPRRIILCDSSHCFSKTLQNYCTKNDDCTRVLWTITPRAMDPVTLLYHRVMTSIYPTPLGLTIHKYDNKGKLFTILLLLHQKCLIFYKRTIS